MKGDRTSQLRGGYVRVVQRVRFIHKRLLLAEFLHFDKTTVIAFGTRGEEFVVCASLDDASVVHNAYEVCALYGAEAVGYDEGLCGRPYEAVEGFLNELSPRYRGRMWLRRG